MPSRFRQYIAIQLVPSAWLSTQPSGSFMLRSKMPMLSSPRKPPWKMLLPSASLRLTHQSKFSSSLWKTRSRNARSPLPVFACARSGRRAARPRRARAGSRRRSSTRRRGSGRWGACTTRAASARAGPWRTARPRATATTQWNARSHAAYHGNSQVSGIERTSALKTWRQSLLRPVLAGGGRGRLQGVAVEPAPHVVLVELLGPEHSGEGLPHDVLLVVRQSRGNDRGVELVGLCAAQRQRAVELRAERVAAGRRRRRSGAGACARLPPAGISKCGRAAALVPCRSGLTAALLPRMTYSWKASLT